MARAILWVTACAALLAPAAAADLEEAVAVAPGGTLRIDLERGRIEIRSHDRDELRVEARARGVGASGVHFRLEPGEHGALLAAERDEWLGFLSAGPSVTVRAWLPRRYGVRVRSGGGDLDIAGVGGSVEARTRRGAIRVEDIDGDVVLASAGGPLTARFVRGDLTAETSGGRIEAVDVAGDVRAVTSGGRIRLARVRGDAAAHTSGGPIWIEGIAGAVDARTSGGPVLTRFTRAPAGRVETSGGVIEVAFPARAGAELDALSQGGEVTCEHRLAARPSRETGALRGTINGGGDTLRLRTSGGAIHVRRF